MPIQFRKMHAHGDDFVVVDMRGQHDQITPEVARRLGDRNAGIGFNQLAVILDCDDAEARLVFWNPDGSTLNACGSATRGVADILMRETGDRSVSLRTNRGLLHCERTSNTDISVSMGEPLLDWRDIPLATDIDTVTLPIAGSPSACSMGNPHCTFFVDDLSVVDVAAIGPSLGEPNLQPVPLPPQIKEVRRITALDGAVVLEGLTSLLGVTPAPFFVRAHDGDDWQQRLMPNTPRCAPMQFLDQKGERLRTVCGTAVYDSADGGLHWEPQTQG
jgi:hypothetical protein